MKKSFPYTSLPLFLWMVVFVCLPLIYIVVLSFLTRGATGTVVFKFTIDNYLRIFDPVYFRIFIVSMWSAVVISFATLLVGYPFAYYVTRRLSRTKLIIMMLVMIPFWTSSLLRIYGFIILMRRDGVINNILISLGLTDSPFILLYNYGAVLMGTVYMLLPFMIMSVYNSVDKLDWSLVEASRDLGAGRLRTFVYVTLPLTLPGIVVGVTLVFIPAVGLFFISDLLGGAKTMLVGNLIQNQMLSARDWPFGAALSVALALFLLIGIYLYYKFERVF